MGDTWIEKNQSKETPQLPKLKQVHPIKKYLCSPAFQIIVLFIVLSVTIPILIYFFVVDLNYEPRIMSDTCSININFRVPCGFPNNTESECSRIHCCYDVTMNECFHYFPSRYNYLMDSKTNTYKSRQTTTPYSSKGNVIDELKISANWKTANHLQIVFHNSDLEVVQQNENNDYEAIITEDYLGIDVIHKQKDETNATVLTTRLGPVIYSDLYTEWTVNLNATFLAGLGEIYLDNNNSTYKKVIYKNKDDHNSLPIFMAKTRSDGQFYGFSVENEGPLEIFVLPSKLLVFRSLTGENIVLNLFLGPQPKDVRKNMLPKIDPVPKWALGAHICRGGKTSFKEIVAEVTEFYTSKKYLKYQSDCIHENLYVMLHEIQEDELENLSNMIELVKNNSLQFSLSLPPQVVLNNSKLFDDALNKRVLYEFNNTFYTGKYLDYLVAYPDYADQKIAQWMDVLMATTPMSKADAFVFKDNWPEDEKFVMKKSDDLPYLSTDIQSAMSHTIPWDATKESVQHYKKHNQYGIMQEKAVKEKNGDKFSITATSSLNNLSPVHIQNVDISWDNMYRSLKTTLYQSIFGHPLVSVPICGSTASFDPNLQTRLCIRWYIMAATMPLFRVSSTLPRRDLHSLNKNAQTDISKAMQIRENLTDYYNTVLIDGEPLTRPMFYNYPDDINTYNLTQQYMVGDSLLVVQPFSPGADHVEFYLPAHNWYDYFTGAPFKQGRNTLSIVYNDWIMLAAAGKIIPLKVDDSLHLIIAMSETLEAKGELYIDEKEKLRFSATRDGLIVSNIRNSTKKMECGVFGSSYASKLRKAIVYGLEKDNTRKEFPLYMDLCFIAYNAVLLNFD